jgi:CheY-like chemotaxis protein
MIRRRRYRPVVPVSPPHRNGRRGSPAHGRILVVGGHDDTRELLVTILKTEGYDVDLAEDGDAALRRYREQPADIVLMDLYVARVDGVAAILDLCAAFPDIVIVAMSGDDSPLWSGALAEARAAGARFTLRKPLEPWLLLRTLEGLIAARKTLLDRLHRTA